MPLLHVAHAPLQAVLQQTAFTQNCPAEQARPQPPQLAASVRRSWHWLSAQAVLPVVQLGQMSWQEPAAQLEPGGQAWPQAPQFCGSLCRLAHPPLHAVVPELQLNPTHWLLLQTAVLFGGAGQAWPQVPQF